MLYTLNSHSVKICQLYLNKAGYKKKKGRRRPKTEPTQINKCNLHRSTEIYWASQVALVVKNQLAKAEDLRDAGSIPGSGRSPGEGNTPVLLPGEFHGQRSLAGYSPQSSKVRHD